MECKKTILNWSSGKDSAWALHKLRERDDVDVAGLLTTVNKTYDRVSMHGVRVELLKQQAEAVGLPLRIVEIPEQCTNEAYETIMADVVAQVLAEGVRCMAFGDLFLEDIRAYRESKMAGTDMELIFPLWQQPTDVLAREMIEGGLRGVITAVDTAKIDSSFAGRQFDLSLLNDLPPAIDPCGERGEFHTFVYDGPMFSASVDIVPGEVVIREGFAFADILPAVIHAEG